MNIVDYIILAILGINVLYGIYRGFMQTLLSLGAVVVAFFSSFFLYGKVVDWVAKTPNIFNSFVNLLNAKALQSGIQDVSSALSSLNLADISSVMDRLQLPKPLDAILTQGLKKGIETQSTLSLGDFISKNLLSTSLQVLAFIAVFFALYFVSSLVLNMLKGVLKFPALKYMDWLAGALTGFLRGFIILAVLFAIVPLIQSLVSLKEFNLLLNQSKFAPLLLNSSLIGFIIKGSF